MVHDLSAKSDDSKRFASRLAFFYAALFIGFGLHQPFFPIWLKTKGLADAQIGMVLAGGQLIRLFATPVVTYLADKAGVLSYAIVICCCATAVAFIGVGLADSFTMILIGVVITGLVWSPLVPLVDAYGLAGVAKRTLDYGRIRVWGSVAFMVTNIVGGLLLTLVAPEWIVWMIWASLIPLVISSVMLVHDRRDRSVAPSGPGFFNRRFVLIMIAAALLQASHAVYYAFASIHWKSLGYSGFTVGVLWAVAVLAEIVMFWVATRFTRDWRPTTFLLIGGAGGLLRWLLMALDPPLWINGPLQILHAAGFGLVHLGTMSYLAARLPAHQRASGQGTVSVAIGGAMALATLIAGYLYARIGASAYLAMGALCAAGLVVTLIARAMPVQRPAAPVQPQSDGVGG
ncbi:MAG: MFS transporter [Phreatobacter sp.]|uniref:MFS transporter n=1 Tax=Phreatobacter sp. TaxID=1966341 RepID=UPI0027338B0D|nr:MFS transporter [Phreatobacter sp.]MDP2800512.1 MFS transporter [Phreatobacter sp.]